MITIGDDARAHSRKHSKPLTWSHVLEGTAAVLMALAGLASAWSSYQASLWSGVQASHYAESSAFYVESAQASTEAGQLQAVDLVMFTKWLELESFGKHELAQVYQAHFRDEFQPAFKAWLAQGGVGRAAETPFTQPAYHPKRKDDIILSRNKAEAAYEAGQDANQVSDKYVFNGVILASVLFLAGIAQLFRIKAIKALLLVISAVLGGLGIFNLLSFPMAAHAG